MLQFSWYYHFCESTQLFSGSTMYSEFPMAVDASIAGSGLSTSPAIGLRRYCADWLAKQLCYFWFFQPLFDYLQFDQIFISDFVFCQTERWLDVRVRLIRLFWLYVFAGEAFYSTTSLPFPTACSVLARLYHGTAGSQEDSMRWPCPTGRFRLMPFTCCQYLSSQMC